MAADLRSADRATVLKALRERLASAIEAAEPKELAPLVRQMVSVTAELAAIEKSGASRVDDLAKARSRRRSKASAVGGAASGK